MRGSGCGATGDGQLALGDTDDRDDPCKVEGIAAKAVSCGGATSLVISDTGELFRCRGLRLFVT